MTASIVFRNLADAASVRASSSLISAQPALTQQVHVERRWRALNNIGWLVFDLGAATSIDTVGGFGLTATTYRVRISATDVSGAAGELFDSGSLPVDQAYLSLVALAPAPVAGRYVRLDLTHASEDFVEAGRVVIGLRSAFSYNFGYGWGRSFADPSRRTRTIGGQTQVDPRQVYRTIDLTFDHIPEAERYGFIEAIDRENALQRDVLMITDPASGNLARDSVWGLMSETTPVVQPYLDGFSKQYRIEERR